MGTSITGSQNNVSAIDARNAEIAKQANAAKRTVTPKKQVDDSMEARMARMELLLSQALESNAQKDAEIKALSTQVKTGKVTQEEKPAYVSQNVTVTYNAKTGHVILDCDLNAKVLDDNGEWKLSGSEISHIVGSASGTLANLAKLPISFSLNLYSKIPGAKKAKKFPTA